MDFIGFLLSLLAFTHAIALFACSLSFYSADFHKEMLQIEEYSNFPFEGT